jgi:hypothetical protein
MQLGTALDVAIGLSFTYFLLAAIVSFVQEFIAGVFKWRGTYLDRVIDVILDNDPSADFRWGTACAWFKAHLTRGAPSVGITKNDQFNDGAVAKIASAVHTHPLLRNGPKSLPSYVSASNFSRALLEALRDGSSLPAFSQAERTVAALPDGDLKRILTGFLQAAAGDLDKLHGNIERWFDAEMDRLSGIYKRISQYMMLLLGAVLVIALNVNTLYLAKALWV